MTVWAERNHLHGVITSTFGNALDVVNFEDGASAVGEVVRLAAACWVLTMTLTPQENGCAGYFQANGGMAGGAAAPAGSGHFALFDLPD
ncbi:hypothetical protein [Streptomyces prasinus]